MAAGVFAPGHLGELTWQVPFELADAVLEETRARERRLRVLPSRAGIYFMLALGLFPGLGYQQVWAKLTAALDGQGLASPSGKALRDMRRRLGVAPLRALFEVLAGPAAQPSTPGVRFGRYRTVASGGCTPVKVPDTEGNRSWLGKMKAALGVTGYPAVELMTLVETGTRALIGAVFGPPATGETEYARKLLHLLRPDMLLLTDRGFDAAAFLEAVAAAPAQFLARLTATRRLPVLARLDDGTFCQNDSNKTRVPWGHRWGLTVRQAGTAPTVSGTSHQAVQSLEHSACVKPGTRALTCEARLRRLQRRRARLGRPPGRHRRHHGPKFSDAPKPLPLLLVGGPPLGAGSRSRRPASRPRPAAGGTTASTFSPAPCSAAWRFGNVGKGWRDSLAQ